MEYPHPRVLCVGPFLLATPKVNRAQNPASSYGEDGCFALGYIIQGRPPYSLPAIYSSRYPIIMPTNERIAFCVVGSITCVHWLALLWDIWMTIWSPTMNYLPALVTLHQDGIVSGSTSSGFPRDK